MLTAGALTVMRSRMEWGSCRCGWRWVETRPIANCLVTCLRMRARSLSQCGEALRRRPRSTGSGGSGSSLRGQKVGKAAWQRGGACWLRRLWAAYIDCRQMSILMEVCQPLAICLLARPADAPSNFYHPVARFLFDGSCYHISWNMATCWVNGWQILLVVWGFNNLQGGGKVAGEARAGGRQALLQHCLVKLRRGGSYVYIMHCALDILGIWLFPWGTNNLPDFLCSIA